MFLTEVQMDELRLCFVEDGFAWFTSHFEDEWGDDWNDAPYEHNAGTPYEWRPGRSGPNPEYELRKVAWDGDLDTPSEWVLNSPYSVEIGRAHV